MFKWFSKSFLLFFSLFTLKSHAFLSEILEAKEQVDKASATITSVTDTIDEVGSLVGIEDNYLAYEKELREFQRTIDEYERLGLDVRDFTEMRAYDPSSLRGQISFFKNYIRRANNLLKEALALL